MAASSLSALPTVALAGVMSSGGCGMLDARGAAFAIPASRSALPHVTPGESKLLVSSSQRTQEQRSPQAARAGRRSGRGGGGGLTQGRAGAVAATAAGLGAVAVAASAAAARRAVRLRRPRRGRGPHRRAASGASTGGGGSFSGGTAAPAAAAAAAVEEEEVKEVVSTSDRKEPLPPGDSWRVRRLKDLVKIKEMRTAITSAEFALRLGGAEQPGLVDYENLHIRLNVFTQWLEKQPPDEQLLPTEELWKAKNDLEESQRRVKNRLVEMKRLEQKQEAVQKPGQAADGAGGGAAASPGSGAASSSETAAAEPAASSSTASALLTEPSKILLYLRDDQTVDIDSALKESHAYAPFSSDLMDRLRGKPHAPAEDSTDWADSSDRQGTVSSRPQSIAKKDAHLAEARAALEQAKRKRAEYQDEIASMSPDEDPRRYEELASLLFTSDRLLRGSQIKVLLANIDLIFERVASRLEAELERTSVSQWDTFGGDLKLLVFEFSLLERQAVPYQPFLAKPPKEVNEAGLDPEDLRMLESHIARIGYRLGVPVDVAGEAPSILRPLKRRWYSFRTCLRKMRRGIMFYANGMGLLGQDLQHAVKLALKVAFLNHTLQPRELQTCSRAVKDVFVLIPFLVILLIPLSPPGHVLVFSLIMKVYPDFFPSPFTERRQNVMKIYNSIKPSSEKSWV